MTQAVILAGGKGTRLASVSGGLPKPLVPVGGIPIVERQVALLTRYGVHEIFLTTGYGADVMAARLGDGSRLGATLHYVREERPLGTAGGIASLHKRLSNDFFVVYGDILIHMDLDRLFQFHRDASAVATLVVHPNDHPYDSDVVELAPSGRIRAFHPKPHPANGLDLPNMVSAALYVLSVDALEYIEPNMPQDFIRDIFPRTLEAGARLFGYRTTEYLKDLGTPERLAQVERDLEAGKVDACHWDHRRSTAFLDRDGVINIEINGVHHPDQLELLPRAAMAIRKLNRAGWLVAVVTNQPDIAKGFVSDEELARIHRRLEAELGYERAWLDALVYCPHHPEAGFPGERRELKGPCTCRKPAPGLLESLYRHLPVDQETSVVIGDSWRDMAAAHAFGVDAIGVWTGYMMAHSPPEDHVVDGRPDVMVEDLAQAVSLLLERDPGVDNLADRAMKEFASAGNRPFLILIGGLARAGKSTTAFRLRRQLRPYGFRTLWVRLDDWIVPVEARPVNSMLRDRYRLTEAQCAIEELLRGEVVKAPGYDPKIRGARPSTVTYDPNDVDFLIVEGVPALLLNMTSAFCLRVHVEVPNEDDRLHRLHRLDGFKGLSPEAIHQLDDVREEEKATVVAAATTAQIHLAPLPLGPLPKPGNGGVDL